MLEFLQLGRNVSKTFLIWLLLSCTSDIIQTQRTEDIQRAEPASSSCPDTPPSLIANRARHYASPSRFHRVRMQEPCANNMKRAVLKLHKVRYWKFYVCVVNRQWSPHMPVCICPK